mmetsp:Transcript_12828/g.36946  ORF Transcript_12828/g.36946 Transcript_12828/m.36946 type:complete len:625 (-) Transcript_12828:169-2043(-)
MALAREEGIALIGEDNDRVSSRCTRRLLAGSAFVVGVVVLRASSAARWHALSPTASIRAFADSEGVACAAAGADCRSSRCCEDSGPEGLQCYERDAYWAQCDESCERGVHRGRDTRPWSCKKLGSRSLPGCDAFSSEIGCPRERCEWFGKACAQRCSSLGRKGCDAVDHCTWDGESCERACSTFVKERVCLSKEHSKRCEWRDGTCSKACWKFSSKSSCLTGGRCRWNGACEADPCSAPGEDCTSTRCCSDQRGGGGMTCYEKDRFFATCTKLCDGEDWSCKELGNRTKTQTNCAWAGNDCSSQGLCCNQGFICAKKDKYFTGCIQTFEQTATKKVKIPPPAGWPAEPEFVGGGQYEYEVAPAPKGQEMGTTLYCFMAYLPNSYEQRLVEIARASYASAFACDEHDLFHTWQSTRTKWDSNASTLTNIDVFIDVWNHVKESGKLWKYDWTVKVDPDCVLVPQRLKWHLASLRAPSKTPVYIKNTNLSSNIANGGFLGAVEVFSREALELYFDWWPKCQETIGTKGGEDGFMKRCMDALGVGFMTDGGMFVPDNDPRRCRDTSKAAYHPVKLQENYQCCVDIVNGGKHFIEWGYCKDLPSNWTSKVWPDCQNDACRQPVWVEPTV